jgi:hypothetical protein
MRGQGKVIDKIREMEAAERSANEAKCRYELQAVKNSLWPLTVRGYGFVREGGRWVTYHHGEVIAINDRIWESAWPILNRLFTNGEQPRFDKTASPSIDGVPVDMIITERDDVRSGDWALFPRSGCERLTVITDLVTVDGRVIAIGSGFAEMELPDRVWVCRENAARKGGRPPIAGKDGRETVRLYPEDRSRVDQVISMMGDGTSRPAALRAIIATGLDAMGVKRGERFPMVNTPKPGPASARAARWGRKLAPNGEVTHAQCGLVIGVVSRRDGKYWAVDGLPLTSTRGSAVSALMEHHLGECQA